MKCVLVYSDSRGQHAPHGGVPLALFAPRVAVTPGIEAAAYLCSMKWTPFHPGRPGNEGDGRGTSVLGDSSPTIGLTAAVAGDPARPRDGVALHAAGKATGSRGRVGTRASEPRPIAASPRRRGAAVGLPRSADALMARQRAGLR